MHYDVLILEDEYHAFFACEKFKYEKFTYSLGLNLTLAGKTSIVYFGVRIPKKLKKKALYVTRLMECI